MNTLEVGRSGQTAGIPHRPRRCVTPTGSTMWPSSPAPTRSTRSSQTSRSRSATVLSQSRSSPRRSTPWSTRTSQRKFGRLGGLAVLNLEGIHTRYEDPAPLLRGDRRRPPRTRSRRSCSRSTPQPIQLELIAERVQQMKAEGITVAVSCTPANAKRFAPIAVEAGCDIFVVQSTVTTARHISTQPRGPALREALPASCRIPVVVGNTVGYARHAGAHGDRRRRHPRRRRPRRHLHQPRGPRHRRAAGLGDDRVRRRPRRLLPRDRPLRPDHHRRRHPASPATSARRSPPAPTPSCSAPSSPAPRKRPAAAPPGAWRRRTRSCRAALASPSASTPRSSACSSARPRATTAPRTSIGALRTAMGMCGARTIREFQEAEIVVAPSIKTEGKSYQLAGLT